MAIMVYANQHAFRFSFPPSFWGAVAEAAPTVTSAKFASPATYLDCLAASNNKINFLPIDMMALMFAQQSPDTMTALWATAACMGPQPCIALMDAIEAKDLDRAGEIAKDIAVGERDVHPGRRLRGVLPVQPPAREDPVQRGRVLQRRPDPSALRRRPRGLRRGCPRVRPPLGRAGEEVLVDAS